MRAVENFKMDLARLDALGELYGDLPTKPKSSTTEDTGLHRVNLLVSYSGNCDGLHYGPSALVGMTIRFRAAAVMRLTAAFLVAFPVAFLVPSPWLCTPAEKLPGRRRVRERRRHLSMSSSGRR
jgi:hypothetical protein